MIKYFLIFFFIFSNLKAIEVNCDFEEVYSNGSVQNGFFLMKDEMLRYQYEDNDLFTIFHKKNNFYLVKNNNLKLIQKLEENIDIPKELIQISKNFPNIENKYVKRDMTIILEKALSNNFYKRISIKSEKLNISIFLNNCNFKNISEKYFSHNPYFEFKKK